MEFETVQFFEYNIRSTVIDNVRMYLVADLLNQYNEKNDAHKKFKNYLENKQTKELLQNWLKYTRSSDPSSVCQPCTNDTGGRNSDLQCQLYTKYKKWNIDGVIKYVSISKEFYGATYGYIINEKLLIACLMWADPKFAISVYTFLEEQRAKDNNFLQQTIQQLQAENTTLAETNKQMHNRHVLDDKKYQWSYSLSIVYDRFRIILHSNFFHQRPKGMKTIKGKIYFLTNIPNGYEFRDKAYNRIMEVIKPFGGVPKYYQKSTFIIPRDIWDSKDHSHFADDIQLALKQARQDLNWRNDLDLDADIQ